MKTLLTLLFLLLPLAVEVHRDKNGDAHPNNDWIGRGLLCVMVATLMAVLSHQTIVVAFIRYLVATVLLFTSLFPYVVNFVHLYNKVTSGVGGTYSTMTTVQIFNHVVSHLSDTAWPDKTKWWRALGPTGRLIVNGFMLAVALALL